MSAQDNLSSTQMEKINSGDITTYLSTNSKGGSVASKLIGPYTRFYNFHSKDEHGVPTLFDHYHAGPSIDHLAGDNHSAADVATHLGAVALESHIRYGEYPTHGEATLSKDSSPLVKKIDDRLGRNSGSTSVTNNVSRFDGRLAVRHEKMRFDVFQDHTQTVDPAIVKSGSVLMRSLFSSGRKLNKKQFDQLELPQ